VRSIDLFPSTATAPDGVLHVGGVALDELAERHGTPLYVYDHATLVAGATAYADAVRHARGGGRVHFAAKALTAPGAMRVLVEAGLGVDVASAGEIAAALRAGFVGSDMVVHGNAKTSADLDAALLAGAGLIVLDSADEAAALAARGRSLGVARVDVLVRIRPDLKVSTHEKIATGHAGSKFGLSPPAAVALIGRLEAPLRFAGLHAHLGSQVSDAAELHAAVGALARLAGALDRRVEVLDLGGGLGVAYTPDDVAPDAGAYARAIVAAINALDDPPFLILEPGRSVAARAGVTLYRVVAVKRDRTGPAWVCLDGGMADNPRVALYDASYHFAIAGRFGAPADGHYHLGGHHCESGDRLGVDVPLPAPRVGDVIAVPVTGAYHQSMSSTYNLFGRPAAVLVQDGDARLITRRESAEDLLSREIVPTTTGAIA
jgi:diaminopimelate decarboxylase